MNNIMVLGSTSGAGKSTISALLCKHFTLQGMNVSPFKAQNLSSKTFITPTGEEIGMSQAYQAWACKREPHWSMNPVLFKPGHESSMQIILKGHPIADATSRDPSSREVFMSAVKDGYRVASERSDIVVLEGSGGAAEINLSDRDIANMTTAELADAPVILVGDIDRGGVFAGIYGTFMLLPPEKRIRIKSFIINRFRGDISILEPGIERLEELLDIPCAGVLPYMKSQRITEDLSDTNQEKHVWMKNLEEFYHISQGHLNYTLLEQIVAGNQ
ncbi:MAG: cobyric acid synthase [Euryarchaeota archaeon]|nr:cobyric acid synthase [Euryarchaeota archaeon]